jgi:ERCC4-related helicase
MYKNYKSKRSKMVEQIARRFPTIGLSGSMVTARNIEDLYGQAKALCLDKMVSPNITTFRRDYCIEVVNYAGFIDRFPKKGAVEQIQTKIAKHVHIYFPEETREIRNINVNVEPTASQLRVRHDLVKTYYYEHQDKYGFKLEVKSAAALLVKLQQVSDGILRDGEGHTLSIASNKLRRLQELCWELLNAGERILIWVAFRATANLLREQLSFPVLLLTSEHEFDSKAWHNRRADVCVATVGSGSSLNDFANVRYALLYSTRFSHVQVQQAKGRTNRRSSGEACRYYYYLQTDGFPDRDVLEMVEQSKATEEMVIMATNKIIANTMKNEM